MNQKHISNFIVKNNHAQRIGDGKIKKLGKKSNLIIFNSFSIEKFSFIF